MTLYFRIGSSVRTKVARHGIQAGTTGTITDIDSESNTPYTYKFTADYSNDYQAWYGVNELESAGECIHCAFLAAGLPGTNSIECICAKSDYYKCHIEDPKHHTCPCWEKEKGVPEDLIKTVNLARKSPMPDSSEYEARKQRAIDDAMRSIENRVRHVYNSGYEAGLNSNNDKAYQDGFRAGVTWVRNLINEKMKEDGTDESDRPVEP